MGDCGYLEKLLKSYEEEIMGEAYFRGLTDLFPADTEREKLALLAEVEHCTARATRPILDRHDLMPRPDALLKESGHAEAVSRRRSSWLDLMKEMVDEYPTYLREFQALEQMAPEEDRPVLARLTAHEAAIIDFAKRELAGDEGSLNPLMDYMGGAAD